MIVEESVDLETIGRLEVQTEGDTAGRLNPLRQLEYLQRVAELE